MLFTHSNHTYKKTCKMQKGHKGCGLSLTVRRYKTKHPLPVLQTSSSGPRLGYPSHQVVMVTRFPNPRLEEFFTWLLWLQGSRSHGNVKRFRGTDIPSSRDMIWLLRCVHESLNLSSLVCVRVRVRACACACVCACMWVCVRACG